MTAAVIVLVFLLETAVVAVGPRSATWFAGDGFAWNPVIMRITYLLITSFLLAFVAEREKQIRAEMSRRRPTPCGGRGRSWERTGAWAPSPGRCRGCSTRRPSMS
ncbi:MAG: hypothetical protein MZV64_13985 [Ignavibacteriales bacterium]|nr:hypothetical protein [Ignavibacteriales bacterium]